MNKKEFVLMVVLSLIATGCGRHGKTPQEDEEATTAERVDDHEERNERYMLSVIEEEKERELAWQDSVLEVIEREHDVRYAYLQLLDVKNEEYNDYCKDYNYNDDDKYRYLEIGYFLYDITQDGIPEMWVAVGSPACYYTLRVYTYRNGKAERVIENAGRDPRFYLNQDEHYVVETCERDPAARCDKIMYHDGKFQLIEVFQCWNHYDPIQFETAVRKHKKEIESTSYDEDEMVLHKVFYTEKDVMPILKMFD